MATPHCRISTLPDSLQFESAKAASAAAVDQNPLLSTASSNQNDQLQLQLSAITSPRIQMLHSKLQKLFKIHQKLFKKLQEEEEEEEEAVRGTKEKSTI